MSAEYKECILPICTNTTTTAPGKAFFIIPTDFRQELWIKATRWSKTWDSRYHRGHICEDHFDLEKDLENPLKYRLMKELYPNPKLKPGAVPCLRADQIKEIECLLPEPVPVANPEHLKRTLLPSPHKVKNKWTQISIGKFRNHKHVQVNLKVKGEKRKFEKVVKEENKESEKDISDNDECLTNFTFKEIGIAMRTPMIQAMTAFPETYFGIPKEIEHCLKLLHHQSASKLINTMITLRKIRLNEPFQLLSAYSGFSLTELVNMVVKNAQVNFQYLNSLMFKNKVSSPETSTEPYDDSDIQMVVASFDIPIEESRDPTDRALIQSKSCKRVKFIVTMKPDGVIDYVSEGDKTVKTDTNIFEDSGLLERVTGTVLALNGFKELQDLLEGQGYNLVRPPSAEALKLEDDLVQIGVISDRCSSVMDKIKQFKMISTCITKLVPRYGHYRFLNYAVVIACGIVNFNTQKDIGIHYYTRYY